MSQSNDDYNPRAQLIDLSDNIKRPDRFADTFCTAAKTQKSIDEAIKEIIRSLLKTDTETKESIGKVVKIINREDLWAYFKLIGFGIWSIVLLVIGSFLTWFFTK